MTDIPLQQQKSVNYTIAFTRNCTICSYGLNSVSFGEFLQEGGWGTWVMVLLHDYLWVCPQRLEHISRKQRNEYETGPIRTDIGKCFHVRPLVSLEIKVCGIHSFCLCFYNAFRSMGSRLTARRCMETMPWWSLLYPVYMQPGAYFLFLYSNPLILDMEWVSIFTDRENNLSNN